MSVVSCEVDSGTGTGQNLNARAASVAVIRGSQSAVMTEFDRAAPAQLDGSGDGAVQQREGGGVAGKELREMQPQR
ncbi:hypothetical protein [Amycolatopsis sp. lyj-23]|uniref:hypothetical protein n=1 Tax=Amycolatopsis sp. lyj-23 TaxID=2789283 RepID=UPI00397A3806